MPEETEAKPWLQPVPVEDIWLDREGDYVVVRIRRGDLWYEAIREHIEGHFSHCISAEGIRQLNKPVAWLRQAGIRKAPGTKP